MKNFKYERLENSEDFLRLKKWLDKNKISFELRIFTKPSKISRNYEANIKFVIFAINDVPVVIKFLQSFDGNEKYSYRVFEAKMRFKDTLLGWYDLNNTWPATITKVIRELNAKK